MLHVSGTTVGGTNWEAAGVRIHAVAVSMGGREQHSEAAKELLSLPERPTAILCFSDVMATERVRAAHGLQLHVQEDLSVVGFDDSPVAVQLQPALITVRRFTEKGRLAAKLMTNALANKIGAQTVEHHLLPTELIVRDSRAPPPAKDDQS